MNRHHRVHLATNLDESVVAQCDCEYMGGSHPVATVYRICSRCAATYLTEYVLVRHHLASSFPPESGLFPTEADHHGEFIQRCPECWHDW